MCSNFHSPPCQMNEAAQGTKEGQAVRKRRAGREKRTLQVQEELLETVTTETLWTKIPFLTPAHYDDVVTERTIERRCGYPACAHQLPAERSERRYHISLADARVYDLTERKQYCSDACLQDSLWLRGHLSSIPIHLRDESVLPVSPVEERLVPDLPSSSFGTGPHDAIEGHQTRVERVEEAKRTPTAVRSAHRKNGPALTPFQAAWSQLAAWCSRETHEFLLTQKRPTPNAAQEDSTPTPVEPLWSSSCTAVRAESLIRALSQYAELLAEELRIPAGFDASIASLVSTFSLHESLPSHTQQEWMLMTLTLLRVLQVHHHITNPNPDHTQHCMDDLLGVMGVDQDQFALLLDVFTPCLEG